MTSDLPVRRSDYFDFLAGLGLEYDDYLVKRMNWRHAHIVLPLADEIRGARILDLGSHDGRWPHAYADAGARERPEVVAGTEEPAHVRADLDGAAVGEAMIADEAVHAIAEARRVAAAVGERRDAVEVVLIRQLVQVVPREPQPAPVVAQAPVVEEQQQMGAAPAPVEEAPAPVMRPKHDRN